jgi:hypothetical protein
VRLLSAFTLLLCVSSVVTLKRTGRNVQKKAGVTGRWHDNRHTFITDLAENGDASDETICDIAGHVFEAVAEILQPHPHASKKEGAGGARTERTELGW